MLAFPKISPVIFQIGPLALRWYGLMYAVSFFLLIRTMRDQAKKGFLPLEEGLVERLFILLVVLILLMARVFYLIFYMPDVFEVLRNDPFELIALWHGGLSFHGGFAGMMMASAFVARKAKVPWFSVTDTLALVAPIGLALGRIGNFINGELFGRVTAVPWGMVFPGGGPYPRHPSQLYESFLEGIVLAIVLWRLKPKVRHYGVLSSVFMVGYGLSRITVEFFREPDPQLGLVLGPFTMGQILSFVILSVGIGFLWLSTRKGPLINKVMSLGEQH